MEYIFEKEASQLCYKDCRLVGDILERLLFARYSPSTIESQEPMHSECCAHQFGPDELIYHCECAIDETCVLCAKCWCPNDHEGHNFKYIPSSEGSGTCDCGEVESWKNKLSCPQHQSQSIDLDSNKILRTFVDESEILFKDVVVFMQKALSRLGEDFSPSPNDCSVLWNDESHSFPQVIDVLKASMGISAGKASEIAETVNDVGYAILNDYTDRNIQFQLIRIIGLEVSERESYERLQSLSLIDHILLSLYDIITRYPILSQALMKCLVVVGFEGHDGRSRNFVSRVFRFSKKLNKRARVTFTSLLTLGVQFDFFRDGLLDCFVKYFSFLIEELDPQKDREHNLSLINFGVQLLTIPSVSIKAIKFIKEFSLYLQSVQKSICAPSTCSRSLNQIISIFKYVLCNEQVLESDLLTTHQISSMYLHLKDAPASTIKQRKTDVHVVFESDEWIHEFNLTLHYTSFLYQWMHDNRSNVAKIRSFYDAVVQCDTPLQALADDDGEASRSTSMHLLNMIQPSLWWSSYALYWNAYACKSYASIPQLPSHIVESSLRQLCQFAAVRAKLWIRNGIEVFGQVVSGDHLVNWCYYHIVWFSLTSPKNALSHPLSLSTHKLDPSTIGVDSEEKIAAIKWNINFILRMIFGSHLAISDPVERLKNRLIHCLSTGDKEWSQINDWMDGPILQDKICKELLDDVATLIPSAKPFKNGVFRLKRAYSTRYTPYSWEFNDQQASDSREHMQKIFSFNIYNVEPVNLGLLSPWLACDYGALLLRLLDVSRSVDFWTDDFLLLFKFYSGKAMELDSLTKKWLASRIDSDNRRWGYLSNIDASLGPDLHIQHHQPPPPRSTAKDGKSRSDRKAKVMDAMKRNQSEFLLAHSQELMELDENEDNVELCIYCQEIADQNSDEYGYLAFRWSRMLTHYPSVVDTDNPDRTLLESNQLGVGVSSCFHIVHKDCFDLMAEDICPLCRFTHNTLLIARPTLTSVGDGDGKEEETIIIRDYNKNVDEHMQDGITDDDDHTSGRLCTFLANFLVEGGECNEFESHLGEEYEILANLETCCTQLGLLRSLSPHTTKSEQESVLRIGKLLAAEIRFAMDDNRLAPIRLPLFDCSRKVPLAHEESSILFKSTMMFISLVISSQIASITVETAQHLAALLYYSKGCASVSPNGFYMSQIAAFLEIWFHMDPALIQFAKALQHESSPFQAFHRDIQQLLVRNHETPLRIEGLPKEYSGLYEAKYNCPKCADRSLALLCIFCGFNQCQSYHCFDPSTQDKHAERCTSNELILLYRNKGILQFIAYGSWKRFPLPYLDKNNQICTSFKNSGGPLFLDEEAVEYLLKIWYTSGLVPFVTKD